MSFLKKIRETLDEDFNVSVTENGAIGYRTTGKCLLDINFATSSLRNANESTIISKFIKAYYEDKMLAIKWLFFASDIRGGMGERRLFRVCINWLAETNPDAVRELMCFIPEYSRWDNLFVLLDTKLGDDVIQIIKTQIKEDIESMKKNDAISLLAKWLPSANASSSETKRRARKIISGLGISEKSYRKTLSALRKYLNVVECKMSDNKWSEIDYAAVPSRANLIYNNAFMRRDSERRSEYLKSLVKGDSKINAGVLFPHDIVHKYMDNSGWYGRVKDFDIATEEMWKALPDYVKGARSTICVADGSGSMTSRIGNSNVSCLDVANALAIYFAERCSGEFKNKYITFSENPQIVDIGDDSLRDKIQIAMAHNEVANTNICAVFELVLKTAVKNGMSQSELPENILILSDMEFDMCATNSSAHHICKHDFDIISQMFKDSGYKLPRLVFWNIASRSGTIPIKENELGVSLVSGFSPTVMSMVLSGEADPYLCLLEKLNDKRYENIEKAVAKYI